MFDDVTAWAVAACFGVLVFLYLSIIGWCLVLASVLGYR